MSQDLAAALKAYFHRKHPAWSEHRVNTHVREVLALVEASR